MIHELRGKILKTKKSSSPEQQGHVNITMFCRFKSVKVMIQGWGHNMESKFFVEIKRVKKNLLKSSEEQ